MDTGGESTVGVRGIPTLDCDRLVLRAFTLDDVPCVVELLATPEIATTSLIPFPFLAPAAEHWIQSHGSTAASGEGFTWAVTLRDAGDVIGRMTLATVQEHKRGELGFWLGVPYWNRGYMTEAIRGTLDFAFADLALVRVEGRYFADNAASARVMDKVGMVYEGTFRSYVQKDGRSIDVAMRAIVQSSADRAPGRSEAVETPIAATAAT